MSSQQENVVSSSSAASSALRKKAPYVSRFSTKFNDILNAINGMRKSYTEGEKTLLIALKTFNTSVIALEKAHDRHESKRRNRVVDASQSYVGVNQPKRIHVDLLSFLEANKSRVGEKASKCVRPFMSLNEVNQCILNLAKASGVVVENKYKFNAPTAEAPFVNSLRDLLIGRCPSGFYQTPLDFNNEIETKKMSSWFKHLLTEDAESKAFTQKLVEEKRTALANAAAALAASSDENASSSMMVDTDATTPSETTSNSPVATEESQPKKRKILRKTTPA